MDFVLHLPILTTLFSAFFSHRIFEHYRESKSGPHLLWWGFGVAIYGLGTLFESLVTLFGWNPILFRMWYISGALLGGVPLAQGTVYLLFKRKTANTLSSILVPFLIFAAASVLLAPLKEYPFGAKILSGRVLGSPDGSWTWVRFLSPFINTYAVIFLIGGAFLSAYRYSKNPRTRHRFYGNLFIAVGAILPGIGGSFSRMGHTEVLYVTEFVGILLIFWGYRLCVKTPVDESRLLAKMVFEKEVLRT
ncbi:MAG: hypothetical protein L0196_04325 [candidate division Zixibacteria bacterium]|nr:hypothetical protein [candidate division Zixibacteria bacterium]